MKNFLFLILIAAAGCATRVKTTELYTPTAIFLPDKYNSPDGMSIGKDGCIYLSMNNAGEGFKFQYPAKILRITPTDKIEEVCDLPKHPETGVASPLGNCWGADGNLYVSDNQMFATQKRGMSRLLRVNMERGKAKSVEVVATGLNMANGITARGDCLFVCDTTLDTEAPMASGVYRFKLSELNAAQPVRVTGLGDPHLIFTLKTKNPQHHVGANGIACDRKGNVYVCNFGDVEIWKLTFDATGKVKTSAVFAQGGGLESVDGLQYDAAGENLWVADFLGNAIACIALKTAQITIVAKNGISDGAYGELHAPSECIRRGNKVYTSNIDITYGPHVAHKVHTISVIDLAK
jgi:sugar lactone lactonase YvrE